LVALARFLANKWSILISVNNQEADHAAILGWFAAICDGKNHGEIGLVATCDKDFLPIDDPMVAIFSAASMNLSLRLCHHFARRLGTGVKENPLREMAAVVIY